MRSVLSGTLIGATPTGSCQILHLDIQPISLNILGLQEMTSEIVLVHHGTTGAGNLLCGVAHLLDGGQSLTGLANLLNNLFAALGI